MRLKNNIEISKIKTEVDTSRGQAGVEIVDVICSNKASKYRVSRDVISGLLILPEEK